MFVRSALFFAAICALIGCTARPRALDIRVEVPETVRSRTDHIVLEYRSDDCDGPRAFTTTIRRSADAVLTPPPLHPGPWCLLAFALDGSCFTLARGRIETVLPREDGETLVIPLVEEPAPLCAVGCVDGACEPEPDGGVPDGSVVRIDAGRDGGCDPAGEMRNCRDDDDDGLVDECVAPVDDPEACGDPALPCPSFPHATRACVDCACAIDACVLGYDDCNGSPGDGCETDLSLATSCGACGGACSAPTEPHCLNLASGFECGCSCSGSATEICCAGGCVEPELDEDHCGGCGNACPDPSNPALHLMSAACVAGACTIQCQPPFRDCDRDAANGCEINPYVTSTCGCPAVDCTAMSPGANAHGWTCDGTRCVLECDIGFLDCEMASPGCESSKSDDRTCGNCWTDCSLRMPPEECGLESGDYRCRDIVLP